MSLGLLLDHWSSVRKGLYLALERISDEQLTFSPGEGLWSLGQVALHIASAEHGWFRHVIQNELPEWPQDLELKDHPTVAGIRLVLDKIHDRTLVYLASLDDTGLKRIIRTSHGETFPVHAAVWHVLEHEIHHRGEIYLMLGLLGIDAPDV